MRGYAACKPVGQIQMKPGQTAGCCAMVQQGADDLDLAVSMTDDFDGTRLAGPVDEGRGGDFPETTRRPRVGGDAMQVPVSHQPWDSAR